MLQTTLATTMARHRAAWLTALVAGLSGCAARAVDTAGQVPASVDGAAFLDAFRTGVVALIGERYAEAVPALRRAGALDPGNDEVIYLTAYGAAKLHDRAAVLDELARLDPLHSDLVPQDSEFPELAGDPRFRAITAAIAARAEAESRGVIVAFQVDEPGLEAEGLAYDPASGAFFAGSIRKHKIVRVQRGAAADFATASAGLVRVLGLRVDAGRRRVWAANEGEDGARATLVALDADTGEARGQYTPRTPGKHLLNDVTIAGDGTVLVTDSEAGQVWSLAPGAEALTAVVPAGRFVYPNGIAWDEAAKAVLVADAVTIWRVDLAPGPATGTVTPLAAPGGVSLAGMDGMYLAGDRIIGVQNLAGPGRVVALALAPGHARVIERRVLSATHPALDAPTTGAIGPDGFYLLANSQLHSAKPPAPLIVLRVPMP